jgi:hypothetical protein
MKKFSKNTKLLTLGISVILIAGSSWAISSSMSSANCQADKDCGVIRDAVIFPKLQISDPNIFKLQSQKLIEKGFGKSFRNESWSKQLDLEATGFFLLRDGDVFAVHHPIDSPFKFYEVTRPKYINDQGLNSTGPCFASIKWGDTNFLVQGTDDNLYPFSPYQLCDYGNWDKYMGDLQEGLEELGFSPTPMF